MTTTLRKTILGYLLLCLVAQGLAMQAFASSEEVACHSMGSPQILDVDSRGDSRTESQQTEHSQNQPSCCLTDCDMGSCFSALIPTSYSLHSSPFPVSETAYHARLLDSLTVSLFRPPIIS